MFEKLLAISCELLARERSAVAARPPRRPRQSRRGVLLLVVLSMLVLFMLIGTAFLMSSSASRDSAKANAKSKRLDKIATKRLEEALLKIVRDTDDPHSTVRYHSLLRDLYGTDGFQAAVYSPMVVNLAIPAGQLTRYAGADAVIGLLGPTQGQFIDIYVAQTIPTAADTLTLRNVVKLDRNGYGQPQFHPLPLTKGYYNGCLLTITSGPAAGQSTRILDYEFLAPEFTVGSGAAARTTRVFRFRVMSFPSSSGGSLIARAQLPATDPDYSPIAQRGTELVDLVEESRDASGAVVSRSGQTILVNGRAFSGTGVGYNPLAAAGTPRLNALQIQQLFGTSDYVGLEVALTPNSRYSQTDYSGPIGALPPPAGDPFGVVHPLADFAVLNLLNTNTSGAANITFKYGWFPGPGGPNEDYDAADFQNMILGLQTVTPRARARIVTDDRPQPFEIDDPNLKGRFLRLDLEDVPLPSLHRPDLMNFWYHRLLNSQWLTAAISDPNQRARAILQPYDPSTGARSPWVPSDQIAAQIAALKRKIMMRPIREDHPKFDGSNSQSVSQLPAGGLVVESPPSSGIFQLTVPYWELCGPWDVDNDNDGVPDSVWVDLGDPVQEFEDGTRYKTLYAILCVDLDSRLNVNAHGLVDQINPFINNQDVNRSNLSWVETVNQNGNIAYAGPGPNLAGTTGTSNAATKYSSDQLATGTGYGPPEISLRPVFPAPWANVAGTAFNEGNRDETIGPVDSLAALMSGRLKAGGEGVPGKYGFQPTTVNWPQQAVSAGLNYEYSPAVVSGMPLDLRPPDLAAQIKFFEYPWRIDQRTGFGTPPDLKARYALGLGFNGQPIYEVLYDVNLSTANLPPAQQLPANLLTDSPYELNLSSSMRRDSWGDTFATPTDAWNRSVDHTITGGLPGVSDDAPFATTDLERVLRAFDADAGTLPSRLWDVVDAFDPLKLATYDPFRVRSAAQAVFGNQNQPQVLAAAQEMAAINRRLVTTDSVDLPVYGGSKPSYINELGPDGAPGRAGINDDNANGLDDAGEIGWAGSDDFQSIIEKPLSQATITDILYYRVFLELRKNYILSQGWTEPLTPAQATQLSTAISAPTGLKAQTAALASTNLAQSLLAPELIAGKKMDLNRPFGDGRDSNNDGVVDDPLEAGEPFLDINGNGKRDNGEPFLDLDGNMVYTPPTDGLWQQLWPQALGGNGTLAEPIAFDYTNGAGVPVHPAVTASLGLPATAQPQLRNLESQARQLYARHLYCLMLLLVDQGYIAPVDENDPQIKYYLDTTNGSPMAKNILAALNTAGNANAVQEARRILLRKLTCQMVAQWAINCVDMRDSDAIMTPFEYDEYPWDGWGTPLRDASGNITSQIPIDGDPASDENNGGVIDWKQAGTNGQKAIVSAATTPPGPLPAPAALDQTRGLVWGAERPELLITETLAFHDRRTEDTNSDWTRGYLSTNPREDSITGGTSLDQRLRPRGALFVEIFNPNAEQGQYPAELYSKLVRDPNNPAPVVVQPSSGVELNRLSTYGLDTNTGGLSNMISPANAPTTVKRSPVWRLIVVEEHPQYRQAPGDDPFDNNPNPWGTQVFGSSRPKYPAGTNGFFEAADPDRGPFDQQLIQNNEPYAERSFYFTSDNSERFNASIRDPNTGVRNLEFLGLVKKPDDKLRIPPQVAVGGVPKSVNYFIAANVLDAKQANATVIPDVPIAPVKPGRYAVIGTAGAQYTGLEIGDPQKLDANGLPVRVSAIPSIPPVPRFVTTLSRILMTSGGGGAGVTPAFATDDLQQKNLLAKTRRIELLPCPDPDVQQILVAGNGGTPLFPLPGPNPYNDAADPNNPLNGMNPVQRENEVVKLPPGLPAPFPQNTGDRFRNIFDADNDGSPDPLLVPPCVAVPVANMSASEPLDVYKARRNALRSTSGAQGKEWNDYNRVPANQRIQAKSPGDHWWNPLAAEGEGAYVTNQGQNDKVGDPYNDPFDEADELLRNGTTRNYRTVHLQRLANPMLPWNPLPTLPDGKPNPEHDPKLPVNLYRTIDTASVDLTAYNGASSKEPDDPTQGLVARYARYLPEQGGQQAQQFENIFGPNGRGHNPPHRLNFRTRERGFHNTANEPWGQLELVPRELWRQEPESRFANVDPSVPVNGVYGNDMAEWKVFLSTGDPTMDRQNRIAELQKRVNDLRIRNTTAIDKDIDAIASGPDTEFSNFPTTNTTDPTKKNEIPVRPVKHQFDIILKHSLGFQNESFGALTTRADVIKQGLPVAAYGSPLVDRAVGVNEKFSRAVRNNAITTTTFPWLAWVNRPFVSAEELLQVPATSSSQMLRSYSTIDPTLPASPPNPYDGRGLDAANIPLTVANRLAQFLTPFGHLLNVFQTADFPAGIYPPNGTPTPGADGNWAFIGAPHFYRILDYVHVPSRFVGTDDMLTAEVFNDVPGVPDSVLAPDITGPLDPRYFFQPPFNKVSRERDPGKVNINTVTGRRILNSTTGKPEIWSEVFDGIMQRNRDGNWPAAGAAPAHLGHGGPAWRDVVLSRRGYAQVDVTNTSVDKPSNTVVDTNASGLNPYFPSFFSNPFRSANAGDLVPLPQMLHYGIDATLLRGHHYNRGPGVWGARGDDNGDGSRDDTREAGYGGDQLSVNPATGQLLPTSGASAGVARGIFPLFSESFNAPYVDGERNPYFYYQPMTRLGNLVTTRSNVYAIWITVGYFEVEPAPNFNDQGVAERFGGTTGGSATTNAAAQALYNRVYPDGYMLGKEVGSDTGDVKRHRGFYIVDRSEPVGFKPGEDLNVEKTIRLRRRIE